MYLTNFNTVMETLGGKYRKFLRLFHVFIMF